MDAVLVVKNNRTEIAYQSPEINIYVFNLDSNELYLYADTFKCRVTSVNDDGTVNLRCVDISDGRLNNRIFSNVPVGEVEFYSDTEDDDFMDDDLEDEDDEGDEEDEE